MSITDIDFVTAPGQALPAPMNTMQLRGMIRCESGTIHHRLQLSELVARNGRNLVKQVRMDDGRITPGAFFSLGLEFTNLDKIPALKSVSGEAFVQRAGETLSVDLPVEKLKTLAGKNTTGVPELDEHHIMVHEVTDSTIVFGTVPQEGRGPSINRVQGSATLTYRGEEIRWTGSGAIGNGDERMTIRFHEIPHGAVLTFNIFTDGDECVLPFSFEFPDL